MGKRRFFALTLILMLSWGLALHYGQWLGEEYRGVSIRIHGEVPDENQIKKALAINADVSILGVTGWSRSETMAAITNTALHTNCRARLIAVYGDMREVAPMKLLYGGFPVTEDTDGCIIDEESARALFGSAGVVGARLEAGSKRYVVRGVVQAREPMLLMRDSGARYENLEFECTDPENAKEAAEAFLYRHSLAQEYTAVESGFYGALLAQFTGLPGWLFGAAILFPIIREAFRRRNIPLQLILLSAAFAGVFFVLRPLLCFGIDWPGRFLPSQWSDFLFWSRVFTQEAANFEKAAFLLPLPKDMMWTDAMRRLAISLAVACLSAGALIRSPGDARLLRGVYLLVIPACTGIAVLALHACGAGFAPTTGYLAALVIWGIMKNAWIHMPLGQKALPILKKIEISEET